jgi:hypothetical protein
MRLKNAPWIAVMNLLAMPGAGAWAADAPTPAEARIAFADRHGIYNWQVVNDHTVLVESQDRHWYKATLLGHCFDLPFAERIAFKTNPDGSFDKFSAIESRGQHCPLVSLVAAPSPEKKAQPKAAAGPQGAADKPS